MNENRKLLERHPRLAQSNEKKDEQARDQPESGQGRNEEDRERSRYIDQRLADWAKFEAMFSQAFPQKEK